MPRPLVDRPRLETADYRPYIGAQVRVVARLARGGSVTHFGKLVDANRGRLELELGEGGPKKPEKLILTVRQIEQIAFHHD